MRELLVGVLACEGRRRGQPGSRQGCRRYRDAGIEAARELGGGKGRQREPSRHPAANRNTHASIQKAGGVKPPLQRKFRARREARLGCFDAQPARMPFAAWDDGNSIRRGTQEPVGRPAFPGNVRCAHGKYEWTTGRKMGVDVEKGRRRTLRETQGKPFAKLGMCPSRLRPSPSRLRASSRTYNGNWPGVGAGAAFGRYA